MGKYKTSDDYGIHTIELYARNLKYTEVQKTIDYLEENKKIQKIKSDPYNIDRHLESQYLVEDGIRMRIHQSHDKSNGIGFAINPSTLLSGKYRPVKLWEPTPEAVDDLLKRLSCKLKKLGLDCVSMEDLSLSQMDVTENVWCDRLFDPTVWVRLYRKGIIPRGFKAAINKDKSLNPYLYMIKSKRIDKKSKIQKPSSVVVKVYDKIYELKSNERCPDELKDEKVLRVEVSMKREAFLKKLSLDRGDSLFEMLRAGYDQGEELIAGYVEKMYPYSGKIVRYEQARKIIQEKIKDDLLQEQMLYLLEKTSDSTGVSAAVQKLKDHYNYVDDRRVKKLFAEFNESGISPITKPKGRKWDTANG